MTTAISPWRAFKADPRDWYSEEEIEKSESYQRPVRWANRINTAGEFVLTLAVVATGLAERVIEALGVNGWFLELLVAVAVVTLVRQVVMIPISAWRELGYDKRWEFSNQTTSGFVMDTVKILPLSVLIPLLLFAPMWAVIRATPLWWVWGALVIGVFAVVFGVLAPVLLDPIFNKFTSLEEGPLRDEIFATARRVDADINDVLVMDSSKRDKRPNAYVTGLGKTRRVVLFDTMLDTPPDELATVVAHELGHWKLGHIKRQIPFIVLTGLVSFGLLKLIVENQSVLDFAGVSSLRDPAAFPVFMLAYTTISSITGLASAYLSRAYERQADLFALKFTPDAEDFVSMFRRLSVENLMDLTPTALNRLKRSHPPFAERMAMGRAWSARGSHGEETPLAGNAFEGADPAVI